jgi:putative ABC transport system permease protein
MDRQREFAVRGAVGAGRSRLIRQMLGESVVLAGAAAACGIGLAHAAITASVARASIPVSHLADLAVDARVALFAAALAAAVTILVGLWPALRLTRGALQGALQEAATALTPGPRRRRFAAVLLTGEVAMALVLLASAGLLVRSFLVIANVDPGFVRTNVAVLQVFAYGEQYRTSDQTLAFFGAALERLQNVPGVEAAGLVSAMPFLPANINIQGGFRVEGRPEPRADQQPIADLTVATGGYFTAMRIPLRAGRLFSDEDRAHSRPVAIVNEQLAERYWPDGDPVGHRISVNWQGRWRTMDVIGMVGAIRHESLDADPRAEVFIPLAQLPFGSMTFVVRTSTDPVGLLPALKARIWDVDPALPLYDTATVDALVARSLAPRRVVTDIVGALAALAFVLAASGIYGIVSFATLQRTREFALRMAVGGTAADIRRMVFRDTLPLIAAGLAAGLLGVVAVERIIASLLYGVSPRDPLTLTATSAMLAAAAIAACYLPARRATRIDPLSALRAQ